MVVDPDRLRALLDQRGRYYFDRVELDDGGIRHTSVWIIRLNSATATAFPDYNYWLCPVEFRRELTEALTSIGYRFEPPAQVLTD